MSVSNIKLLEDFIDYTSVRNKVISKNIANVGTANYKREDVVFKDLFAENLASLKTTSSKHIGQNNFDTENRIIQDKSREMDSGINNVNIDEEMADLAENSIEFKFVSQKIGRYFRTLQSVIKGGGSL
jgi:flagellar basal-body rod protein FlgB